MHDADVALAKRCLEAYYARCPQVLPRVPAEMRRGEWQQDDWVGWKLVPSRLTEADVAAPEAELPFRLPPLFRAFLVSYFVLDMDFGDFYLPRAVRRYLFQPDLWRIGYARFAGGTCGDPVCLDPHAPTPDGDFPVVAINHDWIVPHENRRHRDRVEPHAEREAGSFREFFTRRCPGAPGTEPGAAPSSVAFHP